MTENTGIRVGTAVPDFTLETYDPQKNDFGQFDLAAAKKNGQWTILFFYPADFTFVCATEFKALADRYPEFKEKGAEVVTVSTDTKFTHLAWQREEGQLAGVKYPMGADATGNVSRLFGVYMDEAGVALRGTFLINPEGNLVASEVNALNTGRNVDELMRKFDANIHLAKHGDEACPASWKTDGDKTLKPSAAMVGKVDEAMKA